MDDFNEHNLVLNNEWYKRANLNYVFPIYKTINPINNQINNSMNDTFYVELDWITYSDGYFTGEEFLSTSSAKIGIEFNDTTTNLQKFIINIENKFSNLIVDSKVIPGLASRHEPFQIESIIGLMDKSYHNPGTVKKSSVFCFKLDLERLDDITCIDIPLFEHRYTDNKLTIHRIDNMKYNDFKNYLIPNKSQIKMLIQLNKIWHFRRDHAFHHTVKIIQMETKNL